jgi:putative ABC transport system permease protein
MLRNYIRSTFRALRKHRFFTFINITGLSVGIAACLVIIVFVIHEFSYDRFFAHGDRIYRLNTEIKFGSNHFHVATGYPVLPELLSQSYPEIEKTTRIRNWGSRYVRLADSNDKSLEDVVWADSTFFDFFSIRVLEGNSSSALSDPNSVAISQKMAKKYFPNGDVLNQTLVIDKDLNYKVTAVYEDLPVNSHFHFDAVRSIYNASDIKSVTLVGGGDCHVYLRLHPGADVKTLEAKFPAFVVKHVGPQIEAAVGGNDPDLTKFKASGNKWEYSLTNIKDIHLHSGLDGEFEANGNITYVYLFSAIALFILIIACINFMNLSTARSANRAKEVGVRKVMGSQRRQLVQQFLSESFVLTLFSFMLALGIAYFSLPIFNELAGKQLTLPFNQIWFYGLILGACIVVALMAGVYPAFFLSAFKPVSVLKGKIAKGARSGFIRSGLVVFQFIISIFLIIAAITVNRQLNFIQNKNLGFKKDQLIIVKEAYNLENNLQPFKEEVLRNTSIVSGTVSGYVPVAGGWRNGDTFWKGEGQPSQTAISDMVNMQKWSVDLDYLKTYEMKVTAGRSFSPEFPSDSTAIILNETALERFKIEGDPIGVKVSHFGGNLEDGSPDPAQIEMYTIIGVVEDFHFESLKDNIAPLAFFLNKSNGSITFRFNAANTADVINTLETTWKKHSPNNTFQYSFLDDDFARMYSAEQRLGKIFGIFAGLAVLIACLGLFALTAFTAEQRTKEIGIRKALGASINSIVLLLSRDFSKLVLIAFVLAIPAAWFAIDQWLEGYAYKTTIGVTVYALAGGLTLLISFLTMSYQSVKAARSNPVESLRSE